MSAHVIKKQRVGCLWGLVWLGVTIGIIAAFMGLVIGLGHLVD